MMPMPASFVGRFAASALASRRALAFSALASSALCCAFAHPGWAREAWAEEASVPRCAPTGVMLRILAEQYDEVPIQHGASDLGEGTVWVLASPGGETWTVLLEGMAGSCIIASGRDWRGGPPAALFPDLAQPDEGKPDRTPRENPFLNPDGEPVFPEGPGPRLEGPDGGLERGQSGGGRADQDGSGSGQNGGEGRSDGGDGRGLPTVPAPRPDGGEPSRPTLPVPGRAPAPFGAIDI